MLGAQTARPRLVGRGEGDLKLGEGPSTMEDGTVKRSKPDEDAEPDEDDVDPPTPSKQRKLRDRNNAQAKPDRQREGAGRVLGATCPVPGLPNRLIDVFNPKNTKP